MKKGVVVFLDILGFKGIWQRNDADDVLNLLNEVPQLVKDTYRHPPQEKQWPKSSPPRVTILSDTIVITVESEKPHGLLLITEILNIIIVHFHKNNLFVRGAIGYGEYSQSGNTFIGPAIDDVAEWYEKADLIGIIATPKTNYILNLFSTLEFGANGFSVDSYVQYDVPCKQEETYNLNCFNWPGFMQASFNELPDDNLKSKSRLAMEGLFSKQDGVNGPVFLKYENTLLFVDHAVKFMKTVK